MGIKFQSSDKLFSVLRGYKADDLKQPHVALLWRGESPDGGRPASVSDRLGKRPRGIIGLFGLDCDSAVACRADISATWMNVVDLGDNTNHPAKEMLGPQDILRHIAKSCSIQDTTPTGLEQLRLLLQHGPPVRFVFDLTGEQSLQNRKTLCEAVSKLAEQLVASDGQRHAFIVLMQHRYWFDRKGREVAGRVVPYFGSADAWYRTERKYPDDQHEERRRYSVWTRAEQLPEKKRGTANGKGANEPISITDLKPVDRLPLYDRLGELLTSDAGDIIGLLGDAGTGKSHLIQGLTDKLKDTRHLKNREVLVCAAGFNRSEGAQDPPSLLLHLCSSMLWHLGWDSEIPSRDAIVEDEGAEFVNRLLGSLSHYIERPGSVWMRTAPDENQAERCIARLVVLAIDAIDEAVNPDEKDYSAQLQQLRRLFRAFPNPLPDHIHLVTTARPEIAQKIRQHLNPQSDRVINLNGAEWTEQDIPKFVRFNAPTLEAFHDQIVRLGGQNFLATALILAFVLETRRRDEESGIKCVLDNLEHRGDTHALKVFGPIYDMYWQRFEDRGLSNKALITVATVLTASPAAVPWALLSYVAEKVNVDPDIDLPQVLEELEAYSLIRCDEARDEYRIYHESFRAYLAGKLGELAGHANRLTKYQAHMANWCLDWRGHETRTEKAHALRYAARYPIEAGQWDQVYKLLVGPPDGKNFEYLEARMEYDEGTHGLVDDFRRILPCFSEDQCVSLSKSERALLETFVRTFIREQHTFADDPARCFQQLYGPLSSLEGIAGRPAKDWIERVGLYWKNAGRPWLRTLNQMHAGGPSLVLVGHSGPVKYVAFSPNCDRIFSASSDDTCRVWNSRTGNELKVLDGKGFEDVVFTADGPLIATVNDEGICRIWNADSGDTICVFGKSCERVIKVIFSPDGTRMVSVEAVDEDNEYDAYKLRDAYSGSEINVLERKIWLGSLGKFSFSSDGSRILALIPNTPFKLWDAITGIEIASFELESYPERLTLSPEGTRLALADIIAGCEVLDAESGKEISYFGGHIDYIEAVPSGRNYVYSIAFSPEGKRVLSASRDGTCRIWDAETGRGIQVLEGFSGAMTCAVFSSDGTRVVAGNSDGTCKVWELKTNDDDSLSEPRGATANFVSFSTDGKLVVSAMEDGTCRVWDASTGKAIRKLEGHKAGVISAVFSPRGERVLSASRDGTCRIWDAHTGRPIHVLQGHECWVRSAVFSPDGTRVVSAGDDWRIWDATSGSAICVSKGGSVGGGAIYSVAFSPDGRRVLTVTWDYTCTIWNALTGKKIRDFEGERIGNRSVIDSTDNMTLAAFSPDGARIVSPIVVCDADDDSNVVWGGECVIRDTKTAKPICSFGQEYFVECSLAFSADGTKVISANDDGTCAIIDVGTGDVIRVLRADDFAPEVASFAPDGSRVVSVDFDGICRIWDAKSGACESEYFVSHEVNSSAISPDSTRLALATRWGFVLLEIVSGKAKIDAQRPGE